jgi:hypothetical protein
MKKCDFGSNFYDNFQHHIVYRVEIKQVGIF